MILKGGPFLINVVYFIPEDIEKEKDLLWRKSVCQVYILDPKRMLVGLQDRGVRLALLCPFSVWDMLRILEVRGSARPLWKSACWPVPVEPSHLLCINIHRSPLQPEVSSLPLSGCEDCSQHGSVSGISNWQRWPGKPPQIFHSCTTIADGVTHLPQNVMLTMRSTSEQATAVS